MLLCKTVWMNQGWTMLTAAGLAASLLVVGCQSNVKTRTADSQMEMALPELDRPEVAVVVDPSAVDPVAIIGQANAEMGGPAVYTLALVNEVSGLPKAVAQEGKVDFEKSSVVLLGMGEQPTSGYSAKITGLQRIGDTIYVQAVFVRPDAGDAAAQVVTSPWAAAKIAKQADGVSLASDFACGGGGGGIVFEFVTRWPTFGKRGLLVFWSECV